MMKLLIKWFMPSDSGLANLMAEAIRTSVNSATATKEETVAKYATVAKQITEAADSLAQMMSDGKIDELEQEQISLMLLPVATKIKELIKA